MRKVRDVTIELDGRDRGKVFRIHEMASRPAVQWGFRVAQAAIRGGAEVPVEAMGAGIGVILLMTARGVASMPSPEAFDLMEELMGCVKMIRDPGSAPNVETSLLEDDIEEPMTRLYLMDQVLELHAGFSLAGLVSKLTSTPATTSPDSSSTRT